MKTEQSETIKFYTGRTSKLDNILDKLTKNFCAGRCNNGNSGCCHNNAYKFDAPDEMLGLQEKEALKNGWKRSNNINNRCKYHSSEGCKLTLYKPPVCINSLCEDLRRYIEEKHGINGRLFTSLMREANLFCLTRSPGEREKLFSCMDKAIYLGEILAGSGKQKKGKDR